MKSFNKSMIDQALFLIASSYQARHIDDQTFALPTGWGYKLVKKLKLPPSFRSESFGFIMENRKQIIIAFKGSRLKLFDLAIDLDVAQIAYPFVPLGGKTHRGFTSIYCLLRKQILTTLAQREKQAANKTVWVTGYSMGGALATLAGLDIAVNTPFKNPAIYTCASPRVGDPQFASTFNRIIRKSVRIANGYDPIPYQPQPQITPLFTKDRILYHHVKTLFPIHFQCKSKSFSLFRNHMIQNYFHIIRRLDPQFADRMCTDNPGFCPKPTADVCLFHSESLPFFRR